MKTNVVLAKSLLLVASLGFVSTTFAAPATKPGAKPAAVKPAAESEEQEPVIPGKVISRPDGTFLSFTIENNALKLSFYDAKKKEMAPNVARVAARWNPRNKKGEERRILNPSGDGKSLVSAYIQPPYNFIVYLTLLDEAGEATETHTVNYNQATEPDSPSS